MIIFTMKVRFLKCQILMCFFFLLECKKRKSRSHGKRKNGNIKRKTFAEKPIDTSLKDLSIALIIMVSMAYFILRFLAYLSFT